MILKTLQLRRFAIAFSIGFIAVSNTASAQYSVYANQLVSHSSDIDNASRATDADPTNYAVINEAASTAAASNIRVRFAEWGKAGDVVNVTVRANDGLIGLSLLDNVSIKLYDSAGVTPVAQVNGSSLLSVSLLAPFQNIYNIKFITNPASTYRFKDAMVELDNSLAVSLTDFRIYGFNFQRPCPPVLADKLTGSGTSGLLSLASVDNPNRIIDADPSNFATINTTLSLLGIGSAYVETSFPRNAKGGDYVGFTVAADAGVLDLDILGGLTVVTYDVAGKIKETLSGSSSLNLNLLEGSSDRFSVGFTTKAGSYEISKVRLVKTATLGLLTSLRVYNSFHYTIDRAPVTITSSASTTFCEGGSVVLTAFDSLGSSDFVWNTGEIGASITVTAPGNYFVQSMDALSCERRSIPLNIVVHAKPAQPKVMMSGSVLEVPNDFAYYQWYNNGKEIYGSINHTHNVTAMGKYYVMVKDANGCVNNSDTFNVITTGISAYAAGKHQISIYPNPAQNIINIDAAIAVNVQVADLMGRVILEVKNAKTVDMSGVSAGTYIFKFSDANGNFIGYEKVNKIR